MAGICPYCNEQRRMTREHIFPGWLSRWRGPKISFSDSFPGRGIRADLIIRDVCNVCNNGVLADLDSYAESVLRPILEAELGKSVSIIADARLLRWVLKVGYNSERASRPEEVDELRRFVPFITGLDPTPPRQIDLMAALISPVRSTPEEQAAGAGPMLEVSGDKIGEQSCFGSAVLIAPVMSVGPVILQVLAWPPGAGPSVRHQILRTMQTGMGFERLRGGVEVTLHPGQMDARSWLRDVTLDGPDVVIEPAPTPRR